MKSYWFAVASIAMASGALGVPLEAQTPYGSGVTTHGGDSVSVSFVSARINEGDHLRERLRAIVIFSGQSGWTSTPLPDTARLRERQDSLKAATPPGLQTGGVVTHRLIARVAYDKENDALWVLDTRLKSVSIDSATVVVVRAVDSREPQVSVITIAAPPGPTSGFELNVQGSPESATDWWPLLERIPELRHYAHAVFRP